MVRYHVNPETGEKGVCSVLPERCRFRTFENETDADHFSQQVMKDMYGTVHSERRNSSRISGKDLRSASEKVSENIQIENGTMRVIEDLRRNGGVSYVVGGAVRDALADGDDIIHQFPNRKPGPWISHILNKVREEQYAGHFETPDDALRYITVRSGTPTGTGRTTISSESLVSEVQG